MYTEEIFISNRCNLKCKHCHSRKFFGKLTKEDYERLFNDNHFTKLQEGESLSVHFIGGEPLLEYDRIMRYIKKYNSINKKGMIYRITSNFLVDKFDKDDKYYDLLVNKMDYVSTSFDNGELRYPSVNAMLTWYRNLDLINNARRELNKTLVRVFVCVTRKVLEDILIHHDTKLIRFLFGLESEFSFIPLTDTVDKSIINYQCIHDLALYKKFFHDYFFSKDYKQFLLDNDISEYDNIKYNKTVSLIEDPHNLLGCYYNPDTYIFGPMNGVKCVVDPHCNPQHTRRCIHIPCHYPICGNQYKGDKSINDKDKF